MPLPQVSPMSSSTPYKNFSRFQWWFLVVLNTILVLVGLTSGTLLLRFYFEKGGKSTWMGSLVQSIGFPSLLISYFAMRFTSKKNENENTNANANESPSYSVPILFTMYVVLGIIYATANMLYSVGISYLSASTFALISTTQIGFISIFCFFINRQKMSVLIVNSIVILALSSSLVAVDSNSDKPSGVSNAKYVLGVFSTLISSALYALEFSLSQLTFEKVRKKHTYSGVIELSIWSCFTATVATLIGLFASGQWSRLTEEMQNYETGKVSYVITLIGSSIVWQVCYAGQIASVFVVSSLFCNVISVVSYAVIPIAAVIFFHDKMDGVKIIAILMAFWGLFSYLYHHYVGGVMGTRRTGEDLQPNR